MRRRLLAAVLFLLAAAAQAAAPDRLLRPGMTVRDSVGKAPSFFTLEVPADTAVRVSVRRKGVYTELFLREESVRIALSDDSNGLEGEETVVAPIRNSSATYVLEIHPVVHTACGSYELFVDAQPADDAARNLADGYRILNEARLLELKGDAQSFALSAQRFDEAIARLADAGDLLMEAEAIYRSAIVHGQMSHTAESIRRIEAVLPRFRALGFAGAEGRALDRRGEYARRIGDIVTAEGYFARALPLVRQAGDLEGESDTRNNHGLLLEQSGRWDEAIAMLESAGDIAEGGTSLDVRAAIYGNIGQAYADMGDYTRALEALNRSLELKRANKVFPAGPRVRFSPSPTAMRLWATRPALSRSWMKRRGFSRFRVILRASERRCRRAGVTSSSAKRPRPRPTPIVRRSRVFAKRTIAAAKGVRSCTWPRSTSAAERLLPPLASCKAHWQARAIPPTV